MESGHGLILMSLLSASFGTLWGVAKYLLLSRFQSLLEQKASVEQVASDNLVIVLYLARSLFKGVTKILAKSLALAVAMILLYPVIIAIWKSFPLVILLNYVVFHWKLIIQLISSV